MRIGIFGGSFNPVHEGHLALAKAAMSELNLNRVIFVPSYKTPLKAKEGLRPAPLRVRLLKRAIRRQPFFSVSLCEILRQGESFTVDTLRYFKKKFGRQTVLYFLTGADNLNTLPRWKSVKEIFRLCRFVVMTRPGYKLRQNTRRPVLYVPFAALEVSSTALRKQLSGLSAKKRGGLNSNSNLCFFQPRKLRSHLRGFASKPV
ncbi:MAG: nicotinate (nicotinamide) nucleotide adenylyltransferase [Omnitrophica bacterium RIFCSPHIGHO2_02_FULL_51_18]|nr:MAG: nicotinate (nicotinamide) nucleotide adenylyltransferase [Omnitrophica bacterium RIFCSPHIGHO2_02_FULL_51_18]